MVEGILFDWGGVLHDDYGPIAGAADCLLELNRRQMPWRILSNTTSKPPYVLQNKLQEMGVQAAEKNVLTPISATLWWLHEQQQKNQTVEPIALFVDDRVIPCFNDFTVLPLEAKSGARTVVVGDMAEQWHYHSLNRALRLLMQTPTPFFIALGSTRYWQAKSGLCIDVGPIAAALHYASDIAPTTLGKPAQEFFSMALNHLGCLAEHTLMVGDDVVSDIEAAQRYRIQTALVRTGKFRDSDLRRELKPDVVLNSVADLLPWLDRTP